VSLTDKDRYYADIAQVAFQRNKNSADCWPAVARAVLAAPPYVDPVEEMAKALADAGGWQVEGKHDEYVSAACRSTRQRWMDIAKRAIELGAKPAVKS